MTDEVELDAVKATALDYIDGWYTGDADRMERALHPQLIKRIQRERPDGQLALEQMGPAQLVSATNQGIGKADPAPRSDVGVPDVFGRAASVRIDAGQWVDFLHLTKTQEGWKIVNVLWALRAGS
jgi:hypothetical protein